MLLLCSQALAVCVSLGVFLQQEPPGLGTLRRFPDSLQLNPVSLNLSHNRILNLDGQLTVYTHLRFLDLSHNRLSHLPAGPAALPLAAPCLFHPPEVAEQE